jgi:phospholipid/cholesterol/gamma-HCH transport system substrate-binding protein
METKVNYTVVGAFVLVLSAAIIAGVLWLGSSRGAKKSYETYVAFFVESVSGLNVRAPVKYKGVEVGSVREIAIDIQDPDRVRVVLEIERSVPLKEDTFAVLSVQGLTGIAFVELDLRSRDAPLLAPDPKTGLRVIRTVPSMLRRLDTAATLLFTDLDHTAKSVNGMLDEETRAAFRGTLQDLATVVKAVAARSKAIDAALAGATSTLQNTAVVSAQLADVVQRIGRGADAVERAGSEVAAAGSAARAALEDVRRGAAAAGGGVEQFGAESLPDLARLIAEAREAAASLGRVAQELEQNPSALVLGRNGPPPGPGE